MIGADDAEELSASDVSDVGGVIRTELDLLTSLIWSPGSAAAVHALVGDRAHREATDHVPADRIPLSHSLFIHAPHTKIFAVVVALVDEGVPVSPAIIHTRIADADQRQLQPVLIDVASPNGPGPLPGGMEVPYLAKAVVDAYLRRGYAALLSNMSLALSEMPTDRLDAHWAALTDHQHAAERRRRAVLAALAEL